MRLDSLLRLRPRNMPTIYLISRSMTITIANSKMNSRGLPQFTLLDFDALILGCAFAPFDKSGVVEDNHKELAKGKLSRYNDGHSQLTSF